MRSHELAWLLLADDDAEVMTRGYEWGMNKATFAAFVNVREYEEPRSYAGEYAPNDSMGSLTGPVIRAVFIGKKDDLTP